MRKPAKSFAGLAGHRTEQKRALAGIANGQVAVTLTASR
jgi:hypothetical protein